MDLNIKKENNDRQSCTPPFSQLEEGQLEKITAEKYVHQSEGDEMHSTKRNEGKKSSSITSQNLHYLTY